jgi:hypothetical protein
VTNDIGARRVVAVAALAVSACGTTSTASPTGAAPSGDASPNVSDATSADAPPTDAKPIVEEQSAPPDAGDASPFAACLPHPTTGSFPPEVATVLSNKCQTCHQSPPRDHAPFPLLSYDDTVGADSIAPYVGQPIWQVMHAVIQPAGVPHMPFGNAAQLTAAEFQTLDAWLTSCALPAVVEAGPDSEDAEEPETAAAGDAGSE